MARRRKGLPINGWIVVDKPLGLTSTQVIGKVRRATQAAKLGHGGTLDPLATGILPIALGEATKTIAWCQDATKTYRFTIAWGAATTTDDAEGEVSESSEIRPDSTQIESVLGRFIGQIDQIPPIFSALKVDGQRSYDLARRGETPELAARRVTIERLALLDRPDPDHAAFEVICGKGTYVRSLARDLARALGTVGHVAALRRTRVGRFDENAAISVEMLQDLGHGPPPSGILLPVETALDDIPAFALTEIAATRLRQGQTVEVPEDCSGIVRARFADRLVALVEAHEGEARSLRVFNLE